MIRIEMNKSGSIACGVHVASVGGRATLPKLCRQLIVAGYAAHDVALVYRGETPVFNPTPLSWWAERDVSEGDHSIRWVKHKPFDKSVWV